MQDIKLIKADTCSPDNSVASIAKKMRDGKIRRFFVVDKAQELLGIITTVDIINKVVAPGKDANKTKVSDIMIKKVKVVDINHDLNACLEVMNDLKTFVCPVVDNNKLLGVVSYQNIIASVVNAARK